MTDLDNLRRMGFSDAQLAKATCYGKPLVPEAATPKPNKYHACATIVDGIRFASKAEAARYGELKLLYAARKIDGLRLQPRYKLPGGVVYVGDFSYTQDGKIICEDVKGAPPTAAFRIKERMFREEYPDIELRIVRMK